MLAMLSLIIVLIFMIIFASQNLEAVWVSFVFGPAIKIPLIILLVFSFFAGVTTSTFIGLVKIIKKKRQNAD